MQLFSTCLDISKIMCRSVCINSEQHKRIMLNVLVQTILICIYVVFYCSNFMPGFSVTWNVQSWSGVMSSNPNWVELGVRSTSVLSCTWTKICWTTPVHVFRYWFVIQTRRSNPFQFCSVHLCYNNVLIDSYLGRMYNLLLSTFLRPSGQGKRSSRSSRLLRTSNSQRCLPEHEASTMFMTSALHPM